MKFQWRLSLTAMLASLILSGCAPSTSIITPEMTPAEKQQAQIESLLKKAENSTAAKAVLLKAEAAQLLFTQNNNEQAHSILNSIDLALLPPAQHIELTLLKTQNALDQQQPEQALLYLEQFELRNNTPIDSVQKVNLRQLKLSAYTQQLNHFKALQTLIEISLLQETTDEKQKNHDEIWNKLISLDEQTLTNHLRSGTNSYYEQGWLELFNELRNNKKLDTQHQAVSNWSTLWEAHPARSIPPSALSGLTKKTLSVRKIAVLLPFEGKLSKAATAIKEGLMMAHFRNQTPGKPSPELLFLDSAQINTPIQLAQILTEENADLVIGPLSKDYVNNLASSTHISIPILALNYANDSYREGLYQFGLSAEDEATQIAHKAWTDGIRQVAILTPNSGWGQKIHDSFKESFEELGGTVTTTQSFGDTKDFSNDISNLLSTDSSNQRYKALRQAIYTRKIEFEEHRRTDIDAIILAALPNDARQLSPIMAFNFAGNLPVYATSHLFSGTPDPIQDQDLNKIQFIGTPWALQPPSQNKVLLSQQRNNTNTRLGRLYALGLDAYHIYPYLEQLSALPGTEISGETGILSLNQKGQIQRKLIWARFKEGTPQLIE